VTHTTTGSGRWLPVGRRGRRLLLASVAAFALVAGGVAYATIPDATTGIIHGCYSKTTGALRVIDQAAGQKCVSGEAPLAWNDHGIRWRGAWNSANSYNIDDAVSLNGETYLAKVQITNTSPPGADWALLAARGAAGAPGTPGPAGISTGVSTSSNTSVPLNTGNTLFTVMSTGPVPTSGQYYVNSSIMLTVGAGDGVACIAEENGTEVGNFATVGDVPNLSYQTVSITDTLFLPAGTVLSVQCSDYNSVSQTSFYNGGITATLIDNDNPTASVTPANVKPLKLPPLLGGKAR
jgi:hypothetical protein